MKLSDVLALQAKKKEGNKKPGNGSKPAAPARPAPSAGSAKSVVKVIRTRETPNADALQFVLNAQVLANGNKSYATAKDCKGDPLGEALFDREGVGNVYVMDNFVTVTKNETADWNLLREQVWKIIDQHVKIYPSVEKVDLGEIDVKNFPALSREDKIKAVDMVLDRSIRSNLARDGGGVEVKNIEGKEVSIHYHGACGTCATSSKGTLQFIQTQLRQQLHPEISVRSV